MINKAIEFATRAHAGQFRKGTRRPYIVHPIEVGDIVSTMTQDEEIISAAVLHDTIEDCEGVSREILARKFSERVAGIVAQESEDKTKTWMERKSATIEHIRNAPREVQMVDWRTSYRICAILTGIIRYMEKNYGTVSG